MMIHARDDGDEDAILTTRTSVTPYGTTSLAEEQFPGVSNALTFINLRNPRTMNHWSGICAAQNVPSLALQYVVLISVDGHASEEHGSEVIDRIQGDICGLHIRGRFDRIPLMVDRELLECQFYLDSQCDTDQRPRLSAAFIAIDLTKRRIAYGASGRGAVLGMQTLDRPRVIMDDGAHEAPFAVCRGWTGQIHPHDRFGVSVVRGTSFTNSLQSFEGAARRNTSQLPIAYCWNYQSNTLSEDIAILFSPTLRAPRNARASRISAIHEQMSE